MNNIKRIKFKLKEYKDVIRGINDGNIELTDEQFEFLKSMFLKEGFILGYHNTNVVDVNSFFEKGLYNNRDYRFEKTCDLTNTVAYSQMFLTSLYYHHPRYTTIFLLIPEDIIAGKIGIFEDLKDGKFGIPPKYIVGAFQNGRIYINNSYDEFYYNQGSLKIEEPEIISRTMKDKEEEVFVCSQAYYYARKKENQSRKI
ncbi:MAG: hypothetical protein MR598_05570 [Erysipelotrichaceae bacterium]|nr:hypothetical protein [Erysipelotrichaceae bacterium]